ncbi:MAG TPA: hypothetical protein VMB02_17215 [Candidatus Aquilonibacter sp.]|nr:hypothetical protein [Candidatus Aquilonibacter sp.]
MSRRASQKEKTQTAFQAYLDLLDAAEWFKARLRAPLESFDLTMEGFRVLVFLYQEGALPITEVARRRRCSLQNMHGVIARLEARRWVGRVIVSFPPAEIPENRLPVARRGQPRKGQKIAVVALTKLGKRFVGEVLPSHSKVVKAMMRAVSRRQQKVLSKICRQLRAGDIMRFMREIQMEDVED